jgi:hypothetical protein
MWISRQARPQRGSPWEAAGNRGGTKGGAIFRAEYIAKTRQRGRQKSETSAFTGQSEILTIGALSFPVVVISRVKTHRLSKSSDAPTPPPKIGPLAPKSNPWPNVLKSIPGDKVYKPKWCHHFPRGPQNFPKLFGSGVDSNCPVLC